MTYIEEAVSACKRRLMPLENARDQLKQLQRETEPWSTCEDIEEEYTRQRLEIIRETEGIWDVSLEHLM